MDHLVKPQRDKTVQISVTPRSAGWEYLSFHVIQLEAGQAFTINSDRDELAMVPLRGKGRFSTAGQTFDLSRKGPFAEMPHILYVPPGQAVSVSANNRFEFAYGGAPAEGRYPLRLFRPEEMKAEVRGGGAAVRQVNHVLAHPLPAERLILFEVYVPGGMYSGWPPHCHDGYAGSAYLEETYYYRIDPPESGYCIHRNYRKDSDFDEVYTVRDGELVLVTQGFHPVAVPPGSNVYFLNFLAGELEDAERGRPPYDDPDWGWMKENFEGNKMTLPVVKLNRVD